MVVRKIVKIDESRCDGCGQCISACSEAAIRIIDGKAHLIDERYCDGLGACLGYCPKGAITIEEREAEEFDEETVKSRLKGIDKQAIAALTEESLTAGVVKDLSPKHSALSHWPVKLELISPSAPFFKGADLLVVADCVPFSYADFHEDILKGRVVVAGCPKFGNVQLYREKLLEILRNTGVKTIRVVQMEVPCCSGLRYLVEEALKRSGERIPVERTIIGVKGEKLLPSCLEEK